MVSYSIVVLLVFCCLVSAPSAMEECALDPIIVAQGESRFASYAMA